MVGILDDAGITDLLETARFGHLGCYLSGKVYVVPIQFALMDGDLVGHTTEGTKVNMMRQNPEVCVQFEHIHDLANWTSAILWGSFEEMHDMEAVRAEQILIDRYSPTFQDNPTDDIRGRDFIPPRPGGMIRDRVVYRIRVSSRSGRYERSDA